MKRPILRATALIRKLALYSCGGSRLDTRRLEAQHVIPLPYKSTPGGRMLVLNARQVVGRFILSLPVLAIGAALLGAPIVTGAQPGPPPPLPDNVQVIASGLLNPRGFTWGPDGSIYVAEAGSPPAGYVPSGGPPPAATAPVVNNNGRISRIAPDGTRTTVVDGLPVAVGPIGDTIGPASVAFIGNQLYAIISAGPAHGHPEFAGGVYRVNSDGTLELVVDTDTWTVDNPPVECAHCDTPGDERSNPYDVLAVGGRLYYTDGNKDLVNVVNPAAPDGSRISRLADLSPGGHKVLTGMALAPDGSLYVANLTPAPFLAGGGAVRRVSMSGSVTEVAGGLSAATGVALSPGGGLYVAQIASPLPQPPFLVPPGSVVARGKEGWGPVAAPLMFPTILRWGPDGLYGTNFSVAGNGGEGSLIKINL